MATVRIEVEDVEAEVGEEYVVRFSIEQVEFVEEPKEPDEEPEKKLKAVAK